MKMFLGLILTVACAFLLYGDYVLHQQIPELSNARDEQAHKLNEAQAELARLSVKPAPNWLQQRLHERPSSLDR